MGWLKNAIENRRYIDLINEHENSIKICDFVMVEYFGSGTNTRPYVGNVAINNVPFKNNTYNIDWYCRSDGNIWTELKITKHRKRPPHYGSDDITWVHMSRANVVHINNLTRELWTMHKLTSDTLL
jgi:hypothetical protein